MSATNLSAIIQIVLKIAADFSVDAAVLAGGGTVNVGQVGALGGRPVYVLLTTSPQQPAPSA